MIPANGGSIQIRFLAKMQELKSAQISLNECITYTLNALKGALGSLKEPE